MGSNEVSGGRGAVRFGSPGAGGLAEKTIDDFGEQWTSYRENVGYYASSELFRDLVEPLVSPSEFANTRVADIGSGTGRIVRMLADAGARHIVAVEPSAAYDVLVANTAVLGPRVECLHVAGDRLPARGDLDFVVSFGVLHHVPNPGPVVRACYSALRPGGRILIWLYGREGNRLYLTLAMPVRRLTTNIPHRALDRFSAMLAPVVASYARLCKRTARPLPMKKYMCEHFGRLSSEHQKLTIYDQLNPAYAKYYTRDEAEGLLSEAGFIDVRSHHRHGYSWTVVGTRPGAQE